MAYLPAFWDFFFCMNSVEGFSEDIHRLLVCFYECFIGYVVWSQALCLFSFYASAFRRRRHYVFGLSVRPSVRSKPEIPSFDLYIGPLVHPTNRYRFTACPSVRPSVCPSVRLSVRPSVRRGFRTFAGDCMEGLAWNFTCWCILTIFRTD